MNFANGRSEPFDWISRERRRSVQGTRGRGVASRDPDLERSGAYLWSGWSRSPILPRFDRCGMGFNGREPTLLLGEFHRIETPRNRDRLHLEE